MAPAPGLPGDLEGLHARLGLSGPLGMDAPEPALQPSGQEGTPAQSRVWSPLPSIEVPGVRAKPTRKTSRS